MYEIGQEEIDAVARVIRGGKLFRYEAGECEQFETRYAKFLGVPEVALTASGSNALTAAAVALGLGPGDEVLVPAHTYLATALAVLASGAIPVIVDIDESTTIDPAALENAVGPRTKAVIPVHMWGAACNMDAVMQTAKKHDLFVIEDACQGVGGSYEGRKLGSIGHMGAFSFNMFKNMTCGEGGAVVSGDSKLMERARCVVDPCHFYWSGRRDDLKPFAANGSRANEIQAAILNAQLDRIDGMINTMRAEKRQILEGTRHLADLGLRQTPIHSPDHECGAQAMYLFPTPETAERFSELVPSVIAGKTGRHNYVEWDQVLNREGAAHPLMNPYNMEANKACRQDYSKEMCADSIDILNRTVMIATHPEHTQSKIEQSIRNIDSAARVAFGQISIEEARLDGAPAVDETKFDLAKSD